MVHLWEKVQHGSLKKWSKPFCAFFTTFTVVMTILVLSIDLRGPHYIHFNATNIHDFENTAQDSPRLVKLIREKYMHHPLSRVYNSTKNFTISKPPLSIIKLFRRQRGRVFIECGVYNRGISGGTDWLEEVLEWRGLLTQPHPADYASLLAHHRPRSHTANVCISPTQYPKHALFKNSSLDDGGGVLTGLTTVQCFPLYSLLLAYNTTTVDLLVLNLLSAELQVLKTLPFNRLRIKVIGIVTSEEDDPCCSEEIFHLLREHGFQRMFSCPSKKNICYFVCLHNCQTQLFRGIHNFIRD